MNENLCNGVRCYYDYQCDSGYCSSDGYCSSTLEPWLILIITFFSVFCFCGICGRICVQMFENRGHGFIHRRRHEYVGLQYSPDYRRTIHSEQYIPPPPTIHSYQRQVEHQQVPPPMGYNVSSQQHPLPGPNPYVSSQVAPGQHGRGPVSQQQEQQFQHQQNPQFDQQNRPLVF
ncbi:UNKNOWN [Stylonychia lemnae]|uniref:Uncharacterized protein n=1 Tax=Stylonychia lemnae TaxID=5949 RepID=A0A077ZPX3_STYLE|nr:UNKNOWN [Stylonychia lemnae]|eukprot:CDW71509.1 UNKNOWN [Stylonychia lemnae]